MGEGSGLPKGEVTLYSARDEVTGLEKGEVTVSGKGGHSVSEEAPYSVLEKGE